MTSGKTVLALRTRLAGTRLDRAQASGMFQHILAAPQMWIFFGCRGSRARQAYRDGSLIGALRRLFIAVQLAIVPCSATACIDPSTLVKTTVSISRDLEVEQRKWAPGVVGIAGTGWFLSARLLVTAAHVAEARGLTSANWKEIEVWDGKSKTMVATRIHRLVGPIFEKMALLELKVPLSGAVTLSVRRQPLKPDEPVVAPSRSRHARCCNL